MYATYKMVKEGEYYKAFKRTIFCWDYMGGSLSKTEDETIAAIKADANPKYFDSKGNEIK